MTRLIFSILIWCTLSGCTYSTLHYFPSITGKVMVNGEPLSNVQIEYHSKYDLSGPPPYDRSVDVQYFKTDDGGVFRIPLNTYTGIVGPHFHRIETRILIHSNGKIFNGLHGVRDYKDNRSININHPIELLCDLSNSAEERQISSLNGDRYVEENSTVYSYVGVCAYNKRL